MARCPYSGHPVHDHYRSNRAAFLDLMMRARANGSRQIAKIVQRDAAVLRRAHTEAMRREADARRRSIDDLIAASRAGLAMSERIAA